MNAFVKGGSAPKIIENVKDHLIAGAGKQVEAIAAI